MMTKGIRDAMSQEHDLSLSFVTQAGMVPSEPEGTGGGKGGQSEGSNVVDGKDWSAYWQAQDQPWRREPEISPERQHELDERRKTAANIATGTYSFKDVKLSRADIEWLLATHDNGRGPVDWSDERQRDRVGLDLRGADLRQAYLRELPLACMIGGLRWEDWKRSSPEERRIAAVHLEGANLQEAHLERARLRNAHLEGVNFRNAHLERVHLFQAHLEGADFFKAHLEEANLRECYLQGSDLRLIFFDHGTSLDNATLHDKKYGAVSLAEVHWGDVNLSVIDWANVEILGNEMRARQKLTRHGRPKSPQQRLEDFQLAVRANRQLSVALQAQGLNEDAARFAYRAQCLQRIVLRRQRHVGQYIFSWFLFIIAGYGYRPERSFLAYLAIIALFTFLYHLLAPQLLWNEAFVISMTAFHGRGFFPSTFSPGDPLALASALEAFVGLIIEVTFIATLTQRFFGK